MNRDRFARHPLLFGAYPVQLLERLTGHLGGPAIRAYSARVS